MIDKESKERDKAVESLAEQHGLVDAPFMALRNRINRVLRAELKEFDSGIGIGYADWHIKYGGIEYVLELKPHRSLEQKQPA